MHRFFTFLALENKTEEKKKKTTTKKQQQKNNNKKKNKGKLWLRANAISCGHSWTF